MFTGCQIFINVSFLYSSVPFPAIEKYLLDYQNPRNADALTKIQDDLDETKIILVIKNFIFI